MTTCWWRSAVLASVATPATFLVSAACLSVCGRYHGERSATLLRHCDTVWYVWNSCLVCFHSASIAAVGASGWVRLAWRRLHYCTSGTTCTNLSVLPTLWCQRHRLRVIRVADSSVATRVCCVAWSAFCCSAGQEMSVLLLQLKFHYTGHKSLSLGFSRTWQFITLVTKACHWAVLGHVSALHWWQKPVIGLCSTGVQFAPHPQILYAPWRLNTLSFMPMCISQVTFSLMFTNEG